MSRLGLVAWLAVAAACDTPTITIGPAGYSPTNIVPFRYHWRPGHNIAIYVDRSDEPSGIDLTAAVKSGIAAWTNIARLGDVQMHVVTDVHDADVIFHHYLSTPLVQSDVCPLFSTGAGGQTQFCVTEDSVAVPLEFTDGHASHVKMDVTINSFQLDTVSFFPALVVHEMGHVLGIGSHSFNPSDLMFGRPRRFDPSADDASTLRFVLVRRADVLF